MLTRHQKEEQVADLRDKFERATSVFVADYCGLNVKQMEALRGGIREAETSQGEFRVVKNSVLRIACEGGPVEELRDHFTGTTSVAMSFGDPVSLAKALVDYAKGNEAFELRSAYLDGKVLDREEISTLATLPSLDELRGKLIGLLQAPAGQLARLMNEPGGQLARLVSAREGSLAEGGE